MLSATKAYLCSAFMEYAGLTTLDGTPKTISTQSPPKVLKEYIGSFVDEYVMLEFDVEKGLRQKKEQAEQLQDNSIPIHAAHRSHNDQQSTCTQPGTKENINEFIKI